MCFTDGSKILEGAGVSVYAPDLGMEEASNFKSGSFYSIGKMSCRRALSYEELSSARINRGDD